MIKNFVKVSLMAYLFLFSALTNGQNTAPAWQLEEYQDLFHLNYQIEDVPSKPIGMIYLDGYYLGIQSLLEENVTSEEALEKIKKISIMIEDSEIADPLRQYYLNDLLLWEAVLELKLGNEIRSMWLFNQLFKKSGKLVESHPSFKPGYKVYGILNVLIGAVPDQYQWIFNLLGLQGSLEEGLSILLELANDESHLCNEGLGLYYLVISYLHPEQTDLDSSLIKTYLAEDKDNLLLNFIAGLSMIKTHQSLEARSYFIDSDPSRLHISHYFIGETFLQQAKYPEAISAYQKFLTGKKDDNLVKDAYFKIYLCYFLSGEKEKAIKSRLKALEAGSTRTEADKNAAALLKRQQLPHPRIFQLRFYTDGGFFQEALQLSAELSKKDLSREDEIEFIYRRARLNHLAGNLIQASEDYKMTIALHDGRYFAPNSALQLGHLHRQKGDFDNAILYYEKVLKYSDYPYESSLKSKAKSALKNLNNR